MTRNGRGLNGLPYSFTYADAAARGAAGFADGLTDDDTGKFALQLDDGSLWRLASMAPMTWVAVGGAGGGVLPNRALLHPFQFTRGAGQGNPDAYYWNTRGDMPFNFANVPDGIAEGDTFTAQFPLAPGSYTFTVLGMKNNGMGTVDWNLDGVDIVTGQDWYDPAEVANVRVAATVAVAGETLHTLRWTMVPKNPDSGDNIFAFTAFIFTPA